MKKQKKSILAVLASVMALLLCGCGHGKISAEDITPLAVGDTFTMQNSVEGKSTCRVESVQMSDNLLKLGIDPSEISQSDPPSYINGAGDYVAFSLSDDLDPATGQLSAPWHFVVVEVTMTNIDAIMRSVPEDDDGTRDDSYYTFGIDYLTICDISHETKNDFFTFHYVWYAGTGNYDPTVGKTNGANYYILRPGESLTYQLGFLVGSDDGDFSQFYLTDAGGSRYATDANYVLLGLAAESVGRRN